MTPEDKGGGKEVGCWCFCSCSGGALCFNLPCKSRTPLTKSKPSNVPSALRTRCCCRLPSHSFFSLTCAAYLLDDILSWVPVLSISWLRRARPPKKVFVAQACGIGSHSNCLTHVVQTKRRSPVDFSTFGLHFRSLFPRGSSSLNPQPRPSNAQVATLVQGIYTDFDELEDSGAGAAG